MLVDHRKGGKDRYVMLSIQLLTILRTYWRLAQRKGWLFPGRSDNGAIDVQVLYSAGRSACAAASLGNAARVMRIVAAKVDDTKADPEGVREYLQTGH